MPIKKCLNCDKEFYAKLSQLERRKCCSVKCSSELAVKNKLKECIYCNNLFTPNRGYNAQRYCNRECQKLHTINKKMDCIICGKKRSNLNKKYCSSKCYSTTLNGKEAYNTFWKYATEEESKKRLLDNFNKYVIKNKNGCWGWTGTPSKKYGSLQYKGKAIGAHIASYILFNGSIPNGMFVCHTCDNPKCKNPKHLFLGTPRDNVLDMFKKGRHSIIGNAGILTKFNKLCGENAFSSKLKKNQVIEIKKLLAQGIVMQKIADKFNVGLVTIFDIKHKKTWKHVK